jgi:hypothetical protein
MISIQKAKNYIVDSFQLKIDNKLPIDITLQDYLDSFYINGDSDWTPSGPPKDKKYTFNKKSISISYKGDVYDGYTVSICVMEDENKFFITQVQLSSK